MLWTTNQRSSIDAHTHTQCTRRQSSRKPCGQSGRNEHTRSTDEREKSFAHCCTNGHSAVNIATSPMSSQMEWKRRCRRLVGNGFYGNAAGVQLNDLYNYADEQAKTILPFVLLAMLLVVHACMYVWASLRFLSILASLCV